MEEDKISVELGIETSESESNLEQLSKKLSSLFNKIKNTDATPKINVRPITKEVEDVAKKLANLKKTFGGEWSQEIDGFRVFTKGDQVLATDLEKTTNNINNNLNEGKNNTEDIKDDFEDVEEEVEKTAKQAGFLSRIFARIGKQISRQIYTQIASLLNPINNVRKILSYLTEVVNPRLSATFKNIGENLLEYFATSPLFENLIHQAIRLIYLLQQIFNVFARIFKFGEIDLFKTSLKTGKKLQKMQQQMVAGFDEINDIGGGNQQDQLDATPLGIGELLSEEEKQKLDEFANKFVSVAEIIKKAWDWVIEKFKEVKQFLSDTGWLEVVKENWWKFALAIAGVILVFKLLSGVGTGLSSVVLVCVALAAVFLTLSNLVSELNSGATTTKDIIDILLVVFITIAGLMAAVVLLGPAMADGLGPFLVVVGSIVVVLGVMALTIPIILEALGKFINDVAPAIVMILNTIFNGIVSIVDIIGKSLVNVIKEVGNVFKTVFDGVAKVVDTIGENMVKILNTISKTVDNLLNSIINFINRLGPAINNFVDNMISAAGKLFNFLTKGFETIVDNGVTAINWLFSPLRKVGNFILEKVGLGDFKFNEISKMPRLARLDTGTGYVPNDQLAYIHQGEAVIPKKFNDREYFGGSNSETNDLLETLIDRIDNIDFNPYTTVKDVGKAAYEYIKQTNKQTGRSML